MREAWERHALDWARWAREPNFDAYWKFHGAAFLSLLPPAGSRTIEVGCGEGRVGRDLTHLGHLVVAVDASPTLAALAATHSDTPLRLAIGDAAHLPLANACCELVVAFMSLQDIDGWEAAISEAARVLEPAGRLCLAIVHPHESAGDSYFERRRYVDAIEREGIPMTFHSEHRTIEDYSRALEACGFVIEAVREVTTHDARDPWHRRPMFLHLRAALAGRGS
jgi:SAM-dependent methyltransferase